MRIMRSDDEQIVSAQARYTYGQNNIYYNQQSNQKGVYDAEVDFSYSGRQFMNELARDRQYGTGNIRPVERDMSSFSERMYNDAIEEASRVKTMGYFNDLSKLEGTNPLHNTIPGRLREKANIHLQSNNQKSDFNNKGNNNLDSLTNKDNYINKDSFTNKDSFINKGDFTNNTFPNASFANKSNFINTGDGIKSYSESAVNKDDVNFSFENKEPGSYKSFADNKTNNQEGFMSFNSEMIPPNGNTGTFSNGIPQQNITPNVDINKAGNLDSLMNKVVDNLQHEIETQLVEEGRAELREKVKVQANNLPYKKTKEYTGGSFGKQVAEQELQVRDYKVDKGKQDGKGMGFFTWLLSVPFMIAPIVGFIISGIVSIAVPKDEKFKGFARFCLTLHMVLSLVAVYLYYKGYIDLNTIKKYLNV